MPARFLLEVPMGKGECLSLQADLGDASALTSIGRPVYFDDDRRTSAFQLPKASCPPVRAGGFVGSLAEGGSVECREVTFCPHSGGTHTECAAHVQLPAEKGQDAAGAAAADHPSSRAGADAAVDRNAPPPRLTGVPRSILDVHVPPACAALVVTVDPTRRGDCGEGYPHPGDPDDLVVTRSAVAAAASLASREVRDAHGGAGDDDGDSGGPAAAAAAAAALAALFPGAALVIRVRGFEGSSRRDWDGANPPYLTADAAAWISQEIGFRHLIVELPSVDRGDDGGHLAAHRHFFVADPTRSTITELADVPAGKIADGVFILMHHISPFDLDAAPSNPVLVRSSIHRRVE